MNGNITSGIPIMTDNDNDMISAVEPKGRAAILSTVPKVISRQPSVKNLKKLLKKYDDNILPNFCLMLVHHTIKYKIKKQNKARNVRIKDTIKDDQFVKNKGDSIPFSVNL